MEELLEGPEASCIALTDGERLVPLATCQDYKRRVAAETGWINPRCGKCFEACPMTRYSAKLEGADAKTVVTKVEGTATTQVEVGIGQVFGSYTEITSGLSAGDTVQITFTRPSSTSSTGSQNSGSDFGGGFGGLGGITGGGAPPGGGQPPAGANGGR